MDSFLASGGALLTMVAAIFQHGWTRNRDTVLTLGQLVLGLLLLDVLFQASELLVGFYSGSPDHLGALQAIVGGSFWAGVDTPVGPVYVGYGRAEGGEDAFYISLGRVF